jgi:hypothetical protein
MTLGYLLIEGGCGTRGRVVSEKLTVFQQVKKYPEIS